VYTFNNFKISAVPGTKVSIAAHSNAIDPTKSEKAGDNETYEKLVDIEVEMRL
jgi:hypothetical protein